MRILEVTIQGTVVARVAGESLDHRPTSQTHWSRFSSLDIRSEDGTWLHFDVAPVTEDDAPLDTHVENDDRRVSSLVFEQATSSTHPDVWEVSAVRPFFVLTFRWRNPLTPGSEGLWIRLLLRRKSDGLVAGGEVSDRDTRVWSFSPKANRWLDSPVLPVLGNDASVAQLGVAMTTLEYAADGSGCALLTRAPNPSWLVDIASMKKPQTGFGLELLPPRADLVRPLAARFRAPAGSYPVNGGALAAERRTAAMLEADEIDLTCACRLGEPLGPHVLEWARVGAPSAPPESLSLDAVYQALARHYTLGLASARSRNRLSFAPTRLLADAVRLHFDVTRESTLLREVLVDRDAPVTWVTGAASELGDAPVSLTFTQGSATRVLRDVLGPELEPPRELLRLGGPGSQANGGGWLVNGVELRIEAFERADLSLTQVPGEDRYGQAPVGLELGLAFSRGDLRPISDDPELGFESLSAWLDRERPIVIDVRSTVPRIAFSIREIASELQTRGLTIQVRSVQPTKTQMVFDAVVLDPSPLTAARVQTTTDVDPDGIVAEYTDDGDQAPEWAFSSAGGEMRVVLPPQVIGEEMIKGRLYLDPAHGLGEVPSSTGPFDFRLSPPARLVLDRTDVDTARALAPWSLRRLLGQRPGVVGAKLQVARFELLYGLSTSLEDIPGLRVAELDALVGRVPFADALLDFLRAAREARRSGKKQSAPDALRSDYSEVIAACIRGMLYRSSWWPVFRDFTARQQLTITGRGVSAQLRATRATANPFAIAQYHDLKPRPGSEPPLRGGIDWPFQSRTVYDELTGAPRSSSVALEGLAFGTLGGSGKQTAEFNDGKTLVISETTQGRLDSVTVIRIGRIAMLWNRARHVIVYERTTRVAPRYAGNPPADGVDSWDYQSPAFNGFAALRKVREYVQITERKRTYPDTTSARPIGGPLKASFFETTIIPVKSSWGRDVRSGFVIALRGPLADDEKRFFPFPKIFLECARARGKGEGTVGHQLKDPAELLFYTSTRPQDGGDSDTWPAVADLDFPLIRRKEIAPLPFKPRFASARRQPDARPADFGQRRFTVTLEPPEEAVDLMHGRLSDGIEARLGSMSLARGRLMEGAPVDVTGYSATLSSPMAAAHAQLHDGLSELSMQVAQARATGAHTLGELGELTAEARQLVAELEGKAKDLAGLLESQKNPVPPFGWKREQEEWSQRFTDNAAEQLVSWRKQLDVSAIAQEEVVRLGRSALEGVCQQVRQRIGEAGFLPLEAMNRIDIGQKALEKRAQELVDDVAGGFAAEIDRLAARYREIVAAEESGAADDGPLTVPGLRELQDDVDTVLSDVAAALGRFDGDALKHLTDTVGDWFGGGASGLLATVGTLLRELATDLRLLAQYILRSVPPLDVDEPDWQALKTDFRQLLEDFRSSLVELIEKEIGELRGPIETLLDPRSGNLQPLHDAGQAVEKACMKASADLEKDAKKALAEFFDVVDSQLGGLKGALEHAFQDLQGTKWATAPGTFNLSKDFVPRVDGLFDALRKGLDEALPLDDVERAVREAAGAIGDAIEGTAGQVERAIADELRGLQTAANAVGLELTRALATGPINDAIACTRELLGYYYDAAKDALDVTRASAIFNELGASALNALSVQLPFDKIRDRLLPQLQGLDLGQLLPSFGGLKLEHLFPDLKAPDDKAENDWIRVRHGFDKDRLTAFANVDVDKVIEGTPALFVLPPVSLKLASAHFLASSRLELSANGGKSQTTKASLDGDWMLCLSDKPIVTMKKTTLRYDSGGGFDFSLDSENVVLAEEFQFITQALKDLLPQDEGLTLTPVMPAGIRAELGLPLPDLTTGAFTLTGLTLYAFLELLIVDGFEVRTGFWLSKPERPFGLAILFLGGGGWVGVEVRYRPPDRFVTRVSIGISAGAFVAVNFGIARGSAGILFTAGVEFYRDTQSQGGTTLVTLGILVWGEFSILGIASASLRLSLSVTYDGSNGVMKGKGRVALSIKICWCFTLKVNQEVTQTFMGSGSRRAAHGAAPALAVAVAVAAEDVYSRAVRTVHSNVAL